MKTKTFWKYSEPKTKSSILIGKILGKKLGHTAVKLESRHATGERELTEVLSGTSYPSRKGEEPYTLLNLQQSSEENRKVICVSNQYRLTSYRVPPPELMRHQNQCAWITEYPLPFILCQLCILKVYWLRYTSVQWQHGRLESCIDLENSVYLQNTRWFL